MNDVMRSVVMNDVAPCLFLKTARTSFEEELRRRACSRMRKAAATGQRGEPGFLT